MPGLSLRIIFLVFICWFPNLSNCNTSTWCFDFAVNLILRFRIDGSDRRSNRFRVTFTANGNIRPKVTLPWIRKWTGLQTLQNMLWIRLIDMNYNFFCLDTTSRTNITSESGSDEDWGRGAQRLEHLPSFPGGGGVLPIMTLMGLLRPKAAAFSCLRYMKG